ncbi:MAG: (d)CMP kinase [Victivallales bacterium]|nr:(d)CMP kinase [Victivallales bacterium]
MNQYQIAIDGPAASGKSTVARLVAKRLNACYVNTGSLYRMVALACLEAGIRPKDEPEKVVRALQEWHISCVPDGVGSTQVSFNGAIVAPDRLRTAEVADNASAVAKIPAVRAYMLDRQRDCRSLGVIIMEGRDIGTVILPDATCKFFVTASPEERARRRLAQAGEVPEGATLASVAAEIAARDLQDMNRPIAPLKPAEDSIQIVTDGMTPDEVADRIVSVFRSRIQEGA